MPNANNNTTHTTTEPNPEVPEVDRIRWEGGVFIHLQHDERTNFRQLTTHDSRPLIAGRRTQSLTHSLTAPSQSVSQSVTITVTVNALSLTVHFWHFHESSRIEIYSQQRGRRGLWKLPYPKFVNSVSE